MNALRDLSHSEFVELVKFLNSLSEESNAMLNIGGFFPKLTAVQELELSYVIENDNNERLFEKFKSDYPDLEIDPEGASTPSKKNYWEIAERSINYTYDLAFNDLKSNNFKDGSPDKGNTQIYNSRTLACLKNMPVDKKVIYFIQRKLFIDKFAGYLGLKDFRHIEDILKELGLDYQTFLSYVILYVKEKKYKNFGLFLSHLFKRIELLKSDKELKSQSNREFLESIKIVINKNN
jgi:hypothetical protein